MLPPIARGLALFLGVFTLLNIAGDLSGQAFDTNLWWIDLWPIPPFAARFLLVVFALAAIGSGLVRQPRAWQGKMEMAVFAGFLLAGVFDSIRYFVVLARGEVRSSLPIPVSLLVTIALAAILAGRLRLPSGEPDRERERKIVAATVAVSALVFPLAQITLYGLTDYSRPADLIVAFGAHAYADGTCSDALADRVKTACRLYKAGLAPRLLFSGGPGAGAVDEPEAMRRLAMKLGVPDSAIMKDSNGLNTESTARNTAAATSGQRLRILAVSHFYHLPRVKMTFHRYGMEVYTVPSENSLRGVLPWLIAREEAAFWSYYLRRFRR
ncbi:MAG TPA: YdcF family protein [Thermoanaerobaculia bacterium]|nr:YdcF family protein [Thermoanaerobaculia bacterium]